MRILLLLLAFLAVAAPAESFSVLAHQAVVDRSWDGTIAPEIRRRFPDQALDPARARSFAYGGSHVADLGYFPLGDKLFTELLHYVRTGDFIRALLASARTPDEYAFALGALAHYVADTTGHPEATNKVVAQLYPKLREEFGDQVTYADDHGSHLQTEFRFDVLQMAHAKGGHDVFHHALQFQVATRPLDEAFQQTYGLRLDDLFESTDVAILTYRWAFRGLIHEATSIASELYRAEINELDPEMTPARFVYDLSRADFEKEFGNVYARPGYFVRFVGFLTKLVPDVGPFERAIFKPLPPDVQREFMTTLDRVVARYQATVRSLPAKPPHLPIVNLDTGAAITHGEYPPADDAYAQLLEKLGEREPSAMSAALRADLRRFYRGAPPTADDASRSGVGGRVQPRYAKSSSSP